ncbi:glutamine and serine-rich protein 1-like isoform X3 [Macrobrachium rosenbergii]
MANGTSKPGYISSFMSFIENQDSVKPVTSSSKSGEPATQMASAEDDDPIKISREDASEAGEAEISSTGADLDPPEGEVPPTDHKELDPPEEEVPPTDHTPSDNIADATDSCEATVISDNVERPLIPDTENTNSSEATNNSDDVAAGRRNVARRGRRRSSVTAGKGSPDNAGSGNESVPARETPRRAARYIQHYGNFDIEESDGLGDSDPDYNLSDSDDDPDFNPLNKRQNTTGGSDDDTFNKPRRGRGRGRGMGRVRGRGGMGRGVKRSLDGKEEIVEKPSSTVSSEGTTTGAAKRRGRPPAYVPQVSPGSGDESTVSSTDDKKSPSKLSSSFNYTPVRNQRSNVAIRLPEGPQLTPEQLELVESQFKSGDFVMAKKDMDMMEHPPIWRIDGKSLLQKFQAFEKDGKTLYRNISTYSGWTSQAKALYVGVKVTFVFQSRYDTVVEMVGIKNQEDEQSDTDKPEEMVYLPKNQPQNFEISEELRSHMPDFEIYLQTLISQALDNNFLKEIYEENDDYFVERVKVIDELAEQRKKKIIEIVQWNEKFRNSLDTWPCINVMITKNADTCQACSKLPATKLSQLYGQPYNQETLRSREPLPSEVDTKNYEVCERCSNLSQMYNKVSHQKYDYYSQCKSTVTNMRVTHPSKHTTTILRDLLANDHWIMGLFRSMCTTWIKVDRLYQEECNMQNRNTEHKNETRPSETSEMTT